LFDLAEQEGLKNHIFPFQKKYGIFIPLDAFSFLVEMTGVKSMRYGWPFIALFTVLSIIMLFGKGNFLFIGMKAATKEQYNLKRYSRIFGIGTALMAVMYAIVIYSDRPYELRLLLMPGIPLVFLATAIASRVFAKKK
jgi:hypothetical protein